MSVGYYFDKKRSFATGIAVCGSGIGTFVLSPVNRILFDTYGVNGAFLITAGFVFNLCACGFLIRPISIEPSEIKKNQKNKAISQNDNAANLCSEKKAIYDGNTEKESESKEFIEKNQTAAGDGGGSYAWASPLNSPNILVSDENDQIVEHIIGKKAKNITESLPMVNIESDSVLTSNYFTNNSANQVNKLASSLPMLGDEEFGPRQIRKRTLSRNSQFKATNSAMDMMVMIRSLQNIPVVNEELDDNKMGHSKVRKLSNGLIRKLKNSIDLSLLKNAVFIFFSISNFLTSLGFNTPFIYINDQALKLGIEPTKADILLSTIGISNMVGRIFLGIVSNLKGVNRLYLYSVVITICGIATTIEPFCIDFVQLFIYSIVFGFTSGMYNFCWFLFLIMALKLTKFFFQKVDTSL